MPAPCPSLPLDTSRQRGSLQAAAQSHFNATCVSKSRPLTDKEEFQCLEGSQFQHSAGAKQEYPWNGALGSCFQRGGRFESISAAAQIHPVRSIHMESNSDASSANPSVHQEISALARIDSDVHSLPVCPWNSTFNN